MGGHSVKRLTDEGPRCGAPSPSWVLRPPTSSRGPCELPCWPPCPHPAVPGLQGHQLPEPPLLESWLRRGHHPNILVSGQIVGENRTDCGRETTEALSREPPLLSGCREQWGALRQRPQVGINLGLSLGQSLPPGLLTSSEGTVQALGVLEQQHPRLHPLDPRSTPQV